MGEVTGGRGEKEEREVIEGVDKHSGSSSGYMSGPPGRSRYIEEEGSRGQQLGVKRNGSHQPNGVRKNEHGLERGGDQHSSKRERKGEQRRQRRPETRAC